MVGTSPGLFAQPSPPVTCFQCNGGPNCDAPPRNTSTQICGILTDKVACFKKGPGGATKRGCYSEWGSICIDREFLLDSLDTHGASCYNAIVHKKKTKEIEKCFSDHHTKGDKPQLPTDAETTLCACRKSYCNEGPAEVVVGKKNETPTRRPRKGRKAKINSAEQSTSIFQLISCFLIIATIYN